MLKKYSFLISFLSFSFVTLPAFALPDIGDNSIFECVETEDTFNEGFCYGDISWISNQFGDELAGDIVAPRKARRILRSYLNYFSKERKKSNKADDLDAVAIWDIKIANARASREDLLTCYNNYEECSGGTDDGGNDNGGDNFGTPPALIQACEVIGSPTSEGPRSVSSSNTKFIVNGVSCSGLTTSPVVKILLNSNQHCTGTLILDDTVITAAHCVEDINCRNLSIKTSDNAKSANVSSCTAHEGYGTGIEPQQNDVALLFLSNSITGITPAKINTLTTTAEVGDLAAFAGYGQSEDDGSDLKASFNYISDISTEVISTFYSSGDENRGTTCFGDSGGPLFVYKNGEWRTQGTLSDGSASDCALDGGSDRSNWANLTSTSNQNFIKNNTSGVLD